MPFPVDFTSDYRWDKFHHPIPSFAIFSLLAQFLTGTHARWTASSQRLTQSTKGTSPIQT